LDRNAWSLDGVRATFLRAPTDELRSGILRDRGLATAEVGDGEQVTS